MTTANHYKHFKLMIVGPIETEVLTGKRLLWQITSEGHFVF